MTDTYKAAPECWEWQEKWASKEVPDEDSSCFLELRARIEQLEAHASNLKGSLTSSTPPPVAKVTRDRDETGNYVIVHDTATPPPVATDEELAKTWNTSYVGDSAFNAANRALYNLGIKHGQAGSREVADPAPVAGGLVERVKSAIDSVSLNEEARAAILEVATWLREQGTPASGWAMRLEQEAGR